MGPGLSFDGYHLGLDSGGVDGCRLLADAWQQCRQQSRTTLASGDSKGGRPVGVLLLRVRRGAWNAHRVARKPFDLLDVVPPALHGLILDFEWSWERLWALDVPIRAMPVAKLRWLLLLPWWAYEGTHFAISPDQVRADPDRYHVQHARTMAADLTPPIHVLVRGNRVVTVLDGVHRLLKADLIGMQLIEAKLVSPSCLDAIARR